MFRRGDGPSPRHPYSPTTLFRCERARHDLGWPAVPRTISGAFKNALDWLGLLRNEDPPLLMDTKVVRLISTAGGVQGLSRRPAEMSVPDSRRIVPRHGRASPTTCDNQVFYRPDEGRGPRARGHEGRGHQGHLDECSERTASLAHGVPEWVHLRCTRGYLP